MIPPGLETIIVVIPIHNEEALLPRCIAALTDAIDALESSPTPTPRVTVQLVLDACTDASERIASLSPFHVTKVDFTNVGAARSHGVARALQRRGRTDTRSLWIANTDGDSCVPRNWLTEQVDLARQGADLMIGTVRPDFSDLSEAQRDAWTRTHVPGEANGHVHGANLGFRANRYLEAGAFPELSEHEDVQLVAALRGIPGIVEVASDACWVLTSGRGVGRTAGGYASFLTNDLVASSA